MNYKDFSYCKNMISSRVKINLISSHVKITMTSYVLSRLPNLIVERISIHFYVIKTSSTIARKYSATFGNLRKFSENDRKCSYELRTLFGEFSYIFGNLRKMFGNLRKIAKISLMLVDTNFIFSCSTRYPRSGM